jgi:hypothetical protein
MEITQSNHRVDSLIPSESDSSLSRKRFVYFLANTSLFNIASAVEKIFADLHDPLGGTVRAVEGRKQRWRLGKKTPLADYLRGAETDISDFLVAGGSKQYVVDRETLLTHPACGVYETNLGVVYARIGYAYNDLQRIIFQDSDLLNQLYEMQIDPYKVPIHEIEFDFADQEGRESLKPLLGQIQDFLQANNVPHCIQLAEPFGKPLEYRAIFTDA